jgi:methylenetetrahydrofolate--tRNA-(uracil-5-)-methyltransferase
VKPEIHVIGGGLAGCEAAWQIARAGGRAVLHEMRPVLQTPAHKTSALAELVCSNSLKTEQANSAPWLLKEELRRLGSLLIGRIAPRASVPAGHALAVDREVFAAEVTRAMEDDPAIEIRREEVTVLDPAHIWIVASGPLTSDSLADEIAGLTGSSRLFFYDSISPIVDAESIDRSIAFGASRYGK